MLDINFYGDERDGEHPLQRCFFQVLKYFKSGIFTGSNAQDFSDEFLIISLEADKELQKKAMEEGLMVLIRKPSFINLQESIQRRGYSVFSFKFENKEDDQLICTTNDGQHYVVSNGMEDNKIYFTGPDNIYSQTIDSNLEYSSCSMALAGEFINLGRVKLLKEYIFYSC